MTDALSSFSPVCPDVAALARQQGQAGPSLAAAAGALTPRWDRRTEAHRHLSGDQGWLCRAREQDVERAVRLLRRCDGYDWAEVALHVRAGLSDDEIVEALRDPALRAQVEVMAALISKPSNPPGQ